MKNLCCCFPHIQFLFCVRLYKVKVENWLQCGYIWVSCARLFLGGVGCVDTFFMDGGLIPFHYVHSTNWNLNTCHKTPQTAHFPSKTTALKIKSAQKATHTISKRRKDYWQRRKAKRHFHSVSRKNTNDRFMCKFGVKRKWIFLRPNTVTRLCLKLCFHFNWIYWTSLWVKNLFKIFVMHKIPQCTNLPTYLPTYKPYILENFPSKFFPSSSFPLGIKIKLQFSEDDCLRKTEIFMLIISLRRWNLRKNCFFSLHKDTIFMKIQSMERQISFIATLKSKLS